MLQQIIYALSLILTLASCTTFPQDLPSTCLGQLARSTASLPIDVISGKYCNPNEFIEIEFKLRFGCGAQSPFSIDQGVRFEVDTAAGPWSPIRFYTQNVDPVPSGVTNLVRLQPDNVSVEANATDYTSTLPLLLLDTTEVVTVREYLCGNYADLLTSGETLRLRWMQRFGTSPLEDIATWFLDDIKIRYWRGDCFVPIINDDFENENRTVPEQVGITHNLFSTAIEDEPECNGQTNGGNSVLNFQARAVTIIEGTYRRALVLQIRGPEIGGCEAADSIEDQSVLSSCASKNILITSNVTLTCSRSNVECGCGLTEPGAGICLDQRGDLVTTTEPPPTTTEAPPTTTEPPPTTTEAPPTTTEPPPTTTEPPPTTTEPPPTTTEAPPTTTEAPPTTTEPPPTTTEPPPTTTEAPPITTAALALTSETSTTGTNVNDTASGDPVMAVPIYVSEEQLASMSIDRLSLCYEIHGNSDKWFNLVSDECATVNAHYFGLTNHLNVIDEIGIRTTNSQSQCVNISVSVQNGCSAQVNGVATTRYSEGGVSVRSFSDRVRISVPNCNELTLVMWVFCEKHGFEDVVDDVAGSPLATNHIKFVVMRGLNYGHRLAHGLIGQFWNIPVSVSRFTGRNRFGQRYSNAYKVDVTTTNDQRSYVGFLRSQNWLHEKTPCLYVGSRQSGPIYEIEDPNDGVIEGRYSKYIVSSAFVDDFEYGIFDEDKCL